MMVSHRNREPALSRKQALHLFVVNSERLTTYVTAGFQTGLGGEKCK